MMHDSKSNYIENIKETINISKSSISPHNNEFINWLHHSRVKTLKWVLDQNDQNNSKVLKKIILSKISILNKEKKKAIYRIDTIRITQEINSLKFCLYTVAQNLYKNNSNKES